MKVLAHPEAHPCLGIKDSLIWTKNQKKDVVCLPQKAFLWRRRLVEVIINHAHTTIGHFGQLCTSRYICCYYWWLTMATNIKLFCSLCPSCQVTKDSTKRPAGLLHTLPIPDWLWQSVGMDFMGPLPKLNGHDYLLVVIDHFTSQVHLIPTNAQVKKSPGSLSRRSSDSMECPNLSCLTGT